MDTKNPWTTLSRKEIYQNPWLRLREDQVIRPDGKRGIYAFTETKTAVGVVALDDEERIILIGQYRYPIGEYSWEIVEGGGDPGEEPLATAKRELAEEANFSAADWRPLGGRIHLSNCMSTEVGFLFLARGLAAAGGSPDPTEVLTVQRLPLAAALGMVERGEITDALSIIGITRAAGGR